MTIKTTPFSIQLTLVQLVKNITIGWSHRFFLKNVIFEGTSTP